MVVVFAILEIIINLVVPVLIASWLASWIYNTIIGASAKKSIYNSKNIFLEGPLFDPEFIKTLNKNNNTHDLPSKTDLPILILGSGANGSNNHLQLLENLLPLAGRIKVIALCGRRMSTKILLEKNHFI